VAGASADGEVNHWPAFVDVLTTVIMVVTFLLVIMSAAVMTLSQRVMQNFKQQLIAQENHKHDLTKAHDDAAFARASAAARQDNRIVSPDAESGTSIAELGSILRTENPVDGSERLTIRTRDTRDTLKLQVKAIEESDNSNGTRVQTADVLLKIDFEPTAVKYDADASGKIVAFLKGKARPGMKYEIWSFAPQTSSVAEAQRLSFYRAAMTRNILIRAGIPPAQIETQIRVTDPTAKDGHNVRVVLKP
jgi:outer membrane protein OmpA-like peptidoglycan-associated protein